MSPEEFELLYATCKNCASQVPTGVRLTGALYEVPRDRGYDLTCPNCKTTVVYTKTEFHILPER